MKTGQTGQKKIATKQKLTVAILLALGSMTVNAEMMEIGSGNSNFTMLGPTGGAVGGTNDVVVMWDGTYNTSVDTAVVNMTLSSVSPFFGQPWYAHDVQVFAPGTYVFEACPGPIDTTTNKAADGSIGCPTSAPQTMVVADGQVGVHMLFDWNGSNNIDVINVWDVNAVWGFGPNDGSTINILQTAGTDCSYVIAKNTAPEMSPECEAFFATEWLFTATDPDGNGMAGSGMVDGPFKGFNAAFNIGPTVVPVPAAAWLMGSGLLAMSGFARRKKS